MYVYYVSGERNVSTYFGAGFFFGGGVPSALCVGGCPPPSSVQERQVYRSTVACSAACEGSPTSCTTNGCIVCTVSRRGFVFDALRVHKRAPTRITPPLLRILRTATEDLPYIVSGGPIRYPLSLATVSEKFKTHAEVLAAHQKHPRDSVWGPVWAPPRPQTNNVSLETGAGYNIHRSLID